MIIVSEKFRQQCLAAGRKPFCVIRAGDKEYTDDSIISLEFQDITHAEEMCFGAAPANRLHFELNSEDFIPLSAVIRPYIGFGEYTSDSELCPLGVFYITKRFRRRGRYSVTCYDKMYRLDSKYETKLSYPCTAEEILEEIALTLDFELAASAGDFICEKQPFEATYRDVIGYIAGLSGGCAKFDRYGRLVFRTLSDCGFRLTRDNYISMQLKQDPLVVKQIDVDTGEERFSKGDGSRLTTYVMYNPFGTEKTASMLLRDWEDFLYYGMEIDMQGLPFLESGERLTVQNDVDDSVFVGIISEIDFSYDGTFSAKLYSRSKNPIEEYEQPSEDEALETLSDNLKLVYYTYSNERAVTVGDTLSSIAQMDLVVNIDTSAALWAQLVAVAEQDCRLTLSYTLEDREIPPTVEVDLKAGESTPICLHNFFAIVQSGYKTVRIYAISDGGKVSFAAGKIIATVAGQYLAANSVTRSPNRTIYQEMSGIFISHGKLSALFSEEFLARTQAPIPVVFAEQTTSISIPHDFAYDVSGVAAQITNFVGVQRAYLEMLDNSLYVMVKFYNPAYSDDYELLASAFTVTAEFSEETLSAVVSEVSLDDCTLMRLKLDRLFVAAQRVTLCFDSEICAIIDSLSLTEIPSFEIIVDIE